MRTIFITGISVIVFLAVGIVFLFSSDFSFSAEVSASIITGFVSVVAIVVTTMINIYFNYQNRVMTLRDRIYEKRIEAYDRLIPLVYQDGEITRTAQWLPRRRNGCEHSKRAV